jgi:hypothetical protein
MATESWQPNFLNIVWKHLNIDKIFLGNNKQFLVIGSMAISGSSLLFFGRTKKIQSLIMVITSWWLKFLAYMFLENFWWTLLLVTRSDQKFNC